MIVQGILGTQPVNQNRGGRNQNFQFFAR